MGVGLGLSACGAAFCKASSCGIDDAGELTSLPLRSTSAARVALIIGAGRGLSTSIFTDESLWPGPAEIEASADRTAVDPEPVSIDHNRAEGTVRVVTCRPDWLACKYQHLRFFSWSIR
jgi:hypothetical protein